MPSALTLNQASSATKRPDRRSWVLLVMGIVVMSGLFYFLIVSPQLKKVGLGSEWDIAFAQSQFDQKNLELNQVKELVSNFQALSSDQVSLASRLLPQKRAVPELLAQLETMAKENGATLLSVSVADAVIDANQGGAQGSFNLPYQQIIVKLELGLSDYSSYKAMLEALQSHERLMDVETFIFEPDQERQTLTFKTYYSH